MQEPDRLSNPASHSRVTIYIPAPTYERLMARVQALGKTPSAHLAALVERDVNESTPGLGRRNGPDPIR